MLHRVAWRDVFPWAQVPMGDGMLWTVLPSYPLFPRRITRPGAPVWTLPVRPDEGATIYVPSDVEAVNILRAAFDLQVLAVEPAPSAPWWCPAVMDRVAIGRHLRDFHAVPIGTLGRANEYETHRWHNGLHQQTSIYPLPVRHLHTREVQ